MAHERRRQIDQLFQKLMNFSPIVGIFGHRQVGKTTFASAVAGSYWTLDDRETRRRISADPKRFIEQRQARPVVIDECQLEPDLFPSLKEHVRTKKQPGQFILTGSVRFTSRKAIRESLAGRITNIELYPFVVSELMQEPLSDAVPQLLALSKFQDDSLLLLKSRIGISATAKAFEKYLLNGGLPGLCFVREDRLRREGLLSIHQLILDRDLRLLIETRLSLETLSEWLRWIATLGWNPYNFSEAKRLIGLSHATQRKLLSALEAVFLLRRIPLRGRHGDIFLFEDQFEERVLSESKHPRAEQVLSAFFRNVRAQFQYQLGDVTRFESFWLPSGARVPFVIRNELGSLGFVVVTGEKPTLSQHRSVDSFLRHEPTGKVIYLVDGLRRPRIIEARIAECPVASLL